MHVDRATARLIQSNKLLILQGLARLLRNPRQEMLGRDLHTLD